MLLANILHLIKSSTHRGKSTMSTGNSTTPTPGYAAGNILNMLVHLGADLTGYDFSHLAVWEAYVQGVENGSGNRRIRDREDSVGKVWAGTTNTTNTTN